MLKVKLINMGVRNTSRQAFHSLYNLSKRQDQVFQVLKNGGELSNFDIAKELKMPINSITPRTNELVEKELVDEAYRKIHPITKKRVIYWKIKANKTEKTAEIKVFDNGIAKRLTWDEMRNKIEAERIKNKYLK